MAADNKHKRTNYFINRSFQLKYAMTIIAIILAVTVACGLGLYVGMWSSIIESFSQSKVLKDLETAKRIAAMEAVRYHKGDYRIKNISREAELLSVRNQDELNSMLRMVNESLVPKIAVLVIVIFLSSILISHKMAGPMYRFQKSAEAIRDGDLSVNFHVRKTDEMRDMSKTLDSMLQSLRKDIKEAKKYAEDGKIEGVKLALSKYKI